MRTGEFSHNGTTLYYEMLGDGDKDVVLQHGFSDFTGLGTGTFFAAAITGAIRQKNKIKNTMSLCFLKRFITLFLWF